MMRSRMGVAVLGLMVAVACSRGGNENSKGGKGASPQAGEAPASSTPADEGSEAAAAEPAVPDPVADMAAQGLMLCEALVPEKLRDGAKLTGDRVGRMLTCKLERDGKQEQMIMIDCSGHLDADDMARMGGGLEKVAIGRAAYRNPFGGVSLLASRTSCRVEVSLKPGAEELAKAIDAALGPDHALVASGVLDCKRLIPEALRTALGATAKLEQESVMEGMVSCSIERAARGQLEKASGIPTRTVLDVGYMCNAAHDPVQLLKQRNRRDGDVEVAIGRGGIHDRKRSVVFVDGQAPCVVEVELREPSGDMNVERIATELEAALTADLVGK